MFEKYFAEEQKLISQLDHVKLNEIKDAIIDSQLPEILFRGTVFVAGNAGSFLSACHFVEDLVKPAFLNRGVTIRAVALGANPGLLQAIANDISWEDVFEFELKTQSKTTADLFIGLSVSGNSKNVVKACKWAKEHGLKTIAFVGFNGRGELAKIADIVISIDSENFGIVEDITMACLHSIAQELTRKE